MTERDRKAERSAPPAPTRRIAPGVGIALLLPVSAQVCLGLLSLSPSIRSVAIRSVQVSTAALALFLLLSATRGTAGTDRRHRLAWGLLAGAVAALLVGWILSLTQPLTLSGGPHVQSWLRGAFLLAFYPLLLAGVALLPVHARAPDSQRRVRLDMGLTVASSALVLWIVFIEPALLDLEIPLRSHLFATVLPVGDLLLICALLLLLFGRCSPTCARNRKILAAGAALLMFSDVLFMLHELRGVGESKMHWASLGATAGVALLGLAGHFSSRCTQEEQSPEEAPLRAPLGVSLQIAAACLVLSFGVLIASHVDHIHPVTLLALLLITVLIVARQGTALRESAQLQQELHRSRGILEERVAVRTAELALKLKEVNALRRAAEISAAAESEEHLCEEVTLLVKDTLDPDYCGVALVDPPAGLVRVAASFYVGGKCAQIPPIPLTKGIVGRVVARGASVRLDDVRQDPDYLPIDPLVRSELCVPIRLGDSVIGVFNAESTRPGAFDEADQRMLEGLANQVAVAIGRLRAAEAVKANEARFRALVQHSDDIVTVHTPGHTFAYQSPSLERFLGYPPEALEGRNPLEFVHPEDMVVAKDAMRMTLHGERGGGFSEFRFRRSDGTWAHLETVATTLLDDPAVRGIVLTSRDVTRRKEAERTIRRQLDRLKALRDIDLAIGATSDLKRTLALLLEQVTAQLGVDAADVLLLDARSQTFSFAAGRGLRTDANRHVHLHMGESFAGRAARERTVVAVFDLLQEPGAFARSSLLREEMFAAYFAAPLLTKNQVVGVLEVFHRTPLNPPSQWLEFLETLAGQAAIAIENSTLFENLQRSNAELALAYDVTLQGWSKALELRDHETLGHTERVVDLTVRLARDAGIPEEDLVHVRRGALLHDIGKMGIPDGILLKPGPLNPEEWAVMKRHVDYARDLLSPIEFLRPALDIPVGHHERWDGSGYPLGLKGEAIPLAARAFAVVDVWDALCFDRPYRLAWPPERVAAYLREESGRLLDPRLVDLFLSLDPADALNRPVPD